MNCATEAALCATTAPNDMITALNAAKIDDATKTSAFVARLWSRVFSLWCSIDGVTIVAMLSLSSPARCLLSNRISSVKNKC